MTVYSLLMDPKSEQFAFGTYLLLGDTDDLLCRNIRQALERRGAQVRFLAEPFCNSSRFSWLLDSTRTSSAVVFEDGTRLTDSKISGVLLRHTKHLITKSTDSDDHGYIQAEIQAATLGWIWSLSCPVINRLPAWLWYCPKPPIQFWSRSLRANGLEAVDFAEPRVEGRSASRTGGESFGTGDPPSVCDRACVVGHLTIWNLNRPLNVDRYESALIEFAHRAGLSFLEIGIVATSDGVRVKDVDPFPDLSRFCLSSRRAITAALTKLFTDSNSYLRPE
jgi:hypothetical protein